MSERQVGSLLWDNWTRARDGSVQFRMTEHGLFTDSVFAAISEHRVDFGPCRLIGSSPSPSHDPSHPRGFLRITHYTDPDTFAADGAGSDHYHGGRLHDEIAALLSLEVGARMQAGPATRVIPVDDDPLGEPTSFINIGQRVPVMPRGHGSKILPGAGAYIGLPSLGLLRRYHELDANQSVAVARAARLYQDATWVAEAEPQIAWLLLVSAIEVAAREWGQAKFRDRVANLRDSKPDLCNELETKFGQDAVATVANHYADTSGATRRFREFLSAYCPPPPERRSVEGTRCDWNAEALRRAFTRIYGHRSKALHAGKPFPGILCLAPAILDDVPVERPLARAIATLRTNWAADDLPFYLHIFEYIVRAALLAWWKDLLPLNDAATAG